VATIAETGDQIARFKAAGWATRAVDGHDHGAIRRALAWAVRQDRPTMLACKTEISKGAGRKEGDPNSHGYTLFDDEIADARLAMGWSAAPFVIPEEILKPWRAAGRRGRKGRLAWERRREAAPLGAEFHRAMAGELPTGAFERLDAHVRELAAKPVSDATRTLSGAALACLVPAIPEMVGGSADLTGSNNTRVKGAVAFDRPDYAGRYVHWGVREHGMAAAMNGMALHGGVIPFSGTFLVFSDYSRPAIRLGALMGVRVVHVMTHDSIGLGEDGPTHQPVEHLASLRAMPNLLVFRPADGIEAAECWRLALQARATPSIMALSRQKTPALRTDAERNLCALGAYELLPAEGEALATLFACGTETGIAAQARAMLQAEGVPTRLVSTPCWALFDAQDEAYQAQVIGRAPARVAIEAGVRQGWDRFIGPGGAFVGLSSFGASAPYGVLYETFGITPQAVVAAVKAQLED
jgi:transketolase